jgi:hypothetical protein
MPVRSRTRSRVHTPGLLFPPLSPRNPQYNLNGLGLPPTGGPTGTPFPTIATLYDDFGGPVGANPDWSPMFLTSFGEIYNDGAGRAVSSDPVNRYGWSAYNGLQFGPDVDSFVTVVNPVNTDTTVVRVGVRGKNIGLSTYSTYCVEVLGVGTWRLLRIDNGGAPVVLATGATTKVLGPYDGVAIAAVGTVLTAFWRSGVIGSFAQMVVYDTAGDATKYSTAGYSSLETRNSTLENFCGGTRLGGGGVVDAMLFGCDWERPPAAASPVTATYKPYVSLQAKNMGFSSSGTFIGDALIDSSGNLGGNFAALIKLYGSGGYPGQSGTTGKERVNILIKPQQDFADTSSYTSQQQLIGVDLWFTMRYAGDATAYNGVPVIGQMNWAGPQPPGIGWKHGPAGWAIMLNAGKYNAGGGTLFQFHSDMNRSNGLADPANNVPYMLYGPTYQAYPFYYDFIIRVHHMDPAGVAAGKTAIVQVYVRPKGSSWSKVIDSSIDFATKFATLVTDASGAFSSGFTGWMMEWPDAYRFTQANGNNYYFKYCSVHTSLSSAMAFMR